MSECILYELDEEKFDELSVKSGEDSALGLKLNDIKLLYLGMKEKMGSKYMAAEEMIPRLTRLVPSLSFLKNAFTQPYNRKARASLTEHRQTPSFCTKGGWIMNIPESFGRMVFDDRVMKSVLTAKEYASLKRTIDEGAQLDPRVADAVASAMKNWAVEKVQRILRTGSSL